MCACFPRHDLSAISISLIVGGEMQTRKKHATFVLISALVSVSACTDKWDEIPPDQQVALLRFFDPDDIRKCNIEIKSMTYSDSISGTIGTFGGDHGPAGVYIDESSPDIAEESETVTEIFSPKWRPEIKNDPAFLISEKDREKYSPIRKNIKGYRVVGRNDCVNINPGRFILALNQGDSVYR